MSFCTRDLSQKWFRLCGSAVRNADGDAFAWQYGILIAQEQEGQMAQLQKLNPRPARRWACP